ncbi:hypothetical protein SCALM49S_03529 [Streptomyces californicus]
MTLRNGPDRAATGREPKVCLRTFETASDLRKPCYGRFLAITMRWTWFVPS